MPVAAVTGGNKGIGLAIVRQLALRYPSSALYARTQTPLLIYLTARSRERGQQAVETLNNDAQLQAAKALKAQGGLAEITYEELDVSSEQSITAFAQRVRDKHGPAGGLDILVNNAGVALDGFNADQVRRTLDTNYHGPVRLLAALLPDLLTPHARVVNVSSMIGKLNKYSGELTAGFRAAAEVKGLADPTAPTAELMRQFARAVQDGSSERLGWPNSAYAVSKAGLTSATMALAAHEKATRPADARCINACCPGYVGTDMTKGRGRKTPEQGADTPALLALGDIGGATGQFWERGEVSSW